MENNNKVKVILSSIVYILMAFLCGISILAGDSTSTKLIATLQTACFIVSWLLMMGYIKLKFNKLNILLTILGFILIIPYFSFYNFKDAQECEEIDWNEITLKDDLQSLDKNLVKNGDIYINDGEYFSVDICGMKNSSFENIKKSLKENDFNIETTQEGSGFKSFNSSGDMIELTYKESENRVYLLLTKMEDYKEMIWPTIGLATTIPKPTSIYGKIKRDETNSFGAIIGKTEKDEYNNYVQAVKDAGYVIDYYNTGKSYSAKNSNGASIRVEYISFNSYSISASAKKEETTNEATTTTASPTTTTQRQTTTTTKKSATVSQQNAVKKAKSYLNFTAFSRKGLIEQLEFEGFTHDDAVYGVDNVGADWNEQAVKKAKSYLDFTAFSRKGLIEQLEFEGFTHEQAVYGTEQNGL